MPRQRATLSDLLADDVRDYFRREGVPSSSSSNNQSHAAGDQRQAGRRRSKPRTTNDTTAVVKTATAATRVTTRDENDAANLSTGQSSLSNHRFHRSQPSPRHINRHERSAESRGRTDEDPRHSQTRPKTVSVADAEFLRRYAEERERANSRMAPPRSAAANIVLPSDAPGLAAGVGVDSPSNARPYRTLVGCARPPTVAGSHRPGLASIDNDDWEEDDRIERRDRRRSERRGGISSSERHLRKMSSMGSKGERNGQAHYRRTGVGGLNGTAGVVNVMPASMNHNSPLAQESTWTSLLSQPPWQDELNHSRMDSLNTFVRKESTDSAFMLMRGSSAASSIVSCDYNHADHDKLSSVTREGKREHVRPLSYLSASSDSGEKSKSDHNPSTAGKNAEPHAHNGDPSPLSSSNGTFKTIDRFSIRSKDESDVQSALWGSSILDSVSSPGESEQRQRFYLRGCITREEDSSERESSGECGSSDSEESFTSEDSSQVATSDSGQEENGAQHGNGARQTSIPPESVGLAIKKGKHYSSIPFSSGKRRKRRKRDTIPLRLDDAMKFVWEKILSTLLVLELYISNMPSLVGSLALAWSSLGVDWFKWYEETFDACHPTDYHSQLCVYPEFPGCFTCDTSRIGYQVSLHFHYLCSFIAILLASLLIGKIIIAFPVVRDELANPTTAAPLGLLCMAIEKSFGGNFGVVGMSFTFGASALQTVVAIWFIFISIVYKTLPEPSWFPNTTGLGLAAAKIFLYWSFGGYFLAGLSIVLFVMFYFVALYRIHANIKISAPVCWVQISGPAVVLYGFSIFGQPGSEKDELLLAVEENKQHFLSVHRTYFMPLMHFFFACCMISMASAVYCVSIRYKVFREKEFSPAHVGFCAPMLSHTNAMQVYRSAVKRFSLLPHDHAFKSFLYQYWTLSLISGSVLIVILTWRFFEYLPRWCQIDVDDDEIPPEPEETMLTKLLENGDAKDEMNQDYVSAAVLQANESGALVRVLRDGKMKYMRSRRMPSMGFDPIMSSSQLLDERERLMQHLAYASSLRDRGGTNSFDDALSSFYDRTASLGSSSSSLSSRRNRRNFMSFDASAMMRGDHR